MNLHTDPLTDFQEGQWWIKELDALKNIEGATLDQKRAVAVVHNLLRAAAAQPIPAKPVPSVSEVALDLGARSSLFNRNTLIFSPQQLRRLIRHFMGVQIDRDEAICNHQAKWHADDGCHREATAARNCAGAIMHGSLDAAMRLSCGEDEDLKP